MARSQPIRTTISAWPPVGTEREHEGRERRERRKAGRAGARALRGPLARAQARQRGASDPARHAGQGLGSAPAGGTASGAPGAGTGTGSVRSILALSRSLRIRSLCAFCAT